MKVIQVRTPSEIAQARHLFSEYAAGLKIDLDFQGFSGELASLPGCYSPPQGRLLLAWSGYEAAGCVALRPLADAECELKRMYVRPAFRRLGVGRLLVAAITAEARAIGYARMRLDTLEEMREARRLYESFGFRRCETYYPTPIVHTVFMELDL